MWDAATGKVRTEVRAPQDDPLDLCPPGACPFPDGDLSPDATKVATAGEDGLARVWDAATGKQLRAIEVGEGLAAVEWSPDGRILVALAWDGTLYLYDTKTFRKIRVLRDEPGGPSSSPPSARTSTRADD